MAALTGNAGDERIVPFRGDYYTLKPEARRLVRGLIYPVPDPRFPFLGVHFTRTIRGEVLAGPNAVLAFALEGYRRTAEVWRDWSRRAFTAELQRYVPEVRTQDLVFGPSGVRAQSLKADGTLVDDFSIGEGPHVLHVRNAPSPAATASLAIGREIAGLALSRFGI